MRFSLITFFLKITLSKAYEDHRYNDVSDTETCH